MRRFYCEGIAQKPLIEGDEAKHISRVLRMKAGDEIIVFDGSGNDYYCEITSADEKGVALCIKQTRENSARLDFSLTVYQSVIKKDNMELALQKISEIGAAAFCPFVSKRTVKRPDDKQKLLQKYERVAAESAKQCGRADIMRILPLISFEELQKAVKTHELCLLAYENEEKTIKAALFDTSAKDIAVIIGPEGGFEEEEARCLIEAGAVSCGLGKLILRAETAAIAAAAMIAYEKMEGGA